MKFFFFLLISAALVTGCNSNASEADSTVSTNTSDIPALFERTGKLATAVEWEKTKQKVAELKEKVEKNPNDVKSRLQIATIYITEARITGEHPYYYPAIDKILNGALLVDPNNYDATILKASVKLSQHKFTEAKELAEKAKAINPNNAYAYGLLVDANVELGDYDQAIANSDKMQALKPSLESYSRASYLREIFGDYKGAIEAMKLAVQAGLPGSEPQCWSRNTLADLYLKTGDLAKAEKEFRINLNLRPSYAFSLAGLAKIEQTKKNYDGALALLDSAAAVLPEFSFHEQMAEIFALQGDTEKAQTKYSEVLEMLKEDEESGHLVSLELATVYLKMNKLNEAKKYALMEYKIRPGNIDVNKELAMIAYKEKDLSRFQQYLQTAKRTGSKDPEILELITMANKS
ncbi:MAG TPA: tetratricopeptide repeat protein [Segetibacter sp.]|jgi:tetratricopeptide (TPR) repeat protein